MQGGQVRSLKDDDVLEVLSSYKCYKGPRKENIEVIITQLAPQELVQKSRFSQFRSPDSMTEM